MNSKVFLPEEVEKGLHLDLINYLIEYNKKSDKYYHEFMVTTDSYCTIVNWVDRRYDGEDYNGHFELLKDDQRIVREVYFPDNHYELLPEDEIEDFAEEFLENNEDLAKEWYFDKNIKNFERKQFTFDE